MYLPLRQTTDYPSMELVARTTLPPEALASGIRTALRPLDPNLPVGAIQSLQDLVDKAVSPRRFLVLLLGGFAAFALMTGLAWHLRRDFVFGESAGAGNRHSHRAGRLAG